MAVWGRDDLPPCDPDVVAQDAAVRQALGHVGAYALAVQGLDALGYGLTEADFDAQLWSHLSDRQLGIGGPRRLSAAEIRAAFREGWTVEAIEPAHMETTMEGCVIEAWLATVRRTDAQAR